MPGRAGDQAVSVSKASLAWKKSIPLKRMTRSSSMRTGVRTARDTAAQAVVRGSGV
jgi:hypothetical protein